MHVALLANTAWLDEELSILKHLIVGLIDERIQTTQVIPQSIHHSEFSPFVGHLDWNEIKLYPPLFSKLINRFRISKLADQFHTHNVDLIHALDGRMWHGAVTLANKLDIPAVLSANSHYDIQTARHIRTRIDPALTIFTASTQPLTASLEQAIQGKAPVQFVPTGIYRATGAEHNSPITESPSAIVSGNGRYDVHYQSLLQGIAEMIRIHPNAQFFFDGQGVDQHAIWEAGARLNLLQNISIIPRRLGHRELLLRADVLIHPQPLGRARSITLQAMARSMPIIAQDDPWLDYFIHDQTAWVIAQGATTTDNWTKLLLRLIEQPTAAQKLGDTARNWVTTHRLASQQIEKLTHIYRTLCPTNIKIA
ncbi:glycosyltransferase [Poriferisphaera sp. WC338]|uniref:glycosyltransferase n=1 Tax=Poriferisphaera sp. WC338 TaxID=3425129 RepID=UPI003D8161DB